MTSDKLSYTQLDGFEHLYLEDSFVLDIAAHPGRLTITIELVLTPEHPEYQPPSPSEQYCMRPGVIEFESVRRLAWTGQGTPPSTDASGTIDYGNIEEFEATEDTVTLQGDFGQLEIESTTPTVRLVNPIPDTAD